MPIHSETHTHYSAAIIQKWWRSISQRKIPLSFHDNTEVEKEKEEVEEENCPICLSHIVDSQDVCITECKHKFHLKCILQSSSKSWGSSLCPLCRNTLLPENTQDEGGHSVEEASHEEIDQELFEEDDDLYYSSFLELSYLDSEHIPLPEEDNDVESDWPGARAQMVESEMNQHQIDICSELMMRAFESARTIHETTHRTEMEALANRGQLMYDNGFREGRTAVDEEIRSLREQLNTAQSEIIRLLKEKIGVDEKKKGKSKL
jgi:hypothetical protein